MRKVIFYNLITLDGFFEGPNKEIDWHMVNDEFNDITLEFGKSIDTLLFGRLTYKLMANYWPTDEAVRTDPLIANLINAMPKVVFSRTLERVDWQNTRLVHGDALDEVRRLKQQPGIGMTVFGSAELALELIENELIDEFRIFLNPIVLGSGNPLFKRLRKPHKLKLLKKNIKEWSGFSDLSTSMNTALKNAPHKSKADKITVENVNIPGYSGKVDAEKYHAMKKALLAALPDQAPGLTKAEMIAAVVRYLPEDLFHGGARAGWWSKSVQLDLEAKGLVLRERGKPLRWHRKGA